MTRNDRLAAFFRDRPNAWVSALDLLSVAGTLAWRARISDVRRSPYNLTIENRMRTVRHADGSRQTVSEYRCVMLETEVNERRMPERERHHPPSSLF